MVSYRARLAKRSPWEFFSSYLENNAHSGKSKSCLGADRPRLANQTGEALDDVDDTRDLLADLEHVAAPSHLPLLGLHLLESHGCDGPHFLLAADHSAIKGDGIVSRGETILIPRWKEGFAISLTVNIFQSGLPPLLLHTDEQGIVSLDDVARFGIRVVDDVVICDLPKGCFGRGCGRLLRAGT